MCLEAHSQNIKYLCIKCLKKQIRQFLKSTVNRENVRNRFGNRLNKKLVEMKKNLYSKINRWLRKLLNYRKRTYDHLTKKSLKSKKKKVKFDN